MLLAYNLKTKQTYGLDNILRDASNDYLNFLDVNELFADGDYLYSFIFPHHVLSAKEKSKLEGHTMRKEYANLGKYNNPIIVRFKLKSRSEEHTSELQSRENLVCRLLLDKKNEMR